MDSLKPISINFPVSVRFAYICPRIETGNSLSLEILGFWCSAHLKHWKVRLLVHKNTLICVSLKQSKIWPPRLAASFYLKHFIVLEGERKRSLSEFVEKSDKGSCDCLDPPHYCTVASTETRKIRDFMCGNLFSYLRSTFPLVNRKISFLSQHIFLISDPTPKRQGLFVSLSRSAVKSLFYQWLGKNGEGRKSGNSL